MRAKALLNALFLCLLLAPSAAGAEPVVRLTTLEWPPYTMAAEPHGAVEDVVRQAFKAVGYDLVVDYLPWNRAVLNARTDPAVAGYFPEYASDQVAADFIYSPSVGQGPLGFAERNRDPVTWRELDDLVDIPIGVVSGYINTPEFDSRVAAHRLRVDDVPNDALNLRKLAGGRVRLAVIDRNVMAYLLATDPDLAGLTGKLKFNPHLLGSKDLFVCFRKDRQGREMAALFAQGLAKIDAPAIFKAALARH